MSNISNIINNSILKFLLLFIDSNRSNISSMNTKAKIGKNIYQITMINTCVNWLQKNIKMLGNNAIVSAPNKILFMWNTFSETVKNSV